MRPQDIPPRIQYIRELFAPEDTLLSAIGKQESSRLPIHIGAEEGKLLQWIIQLAQVRTIVEIGTLSGYSTLWMARALPEGGHLYSIEKEEERLAIARKHIAASDVADRITLLHGDAHQILPELEDHAPFDMIFIDADKISYLDYLDWAEKYVRKGGVIIGDNSFLFEAVYLEELPEGVRPQTREVMREFNRRLAEPEKYCSIMLPTKEGMTLAIKQF